MLSIELSRCYSIKVRNSFYIVLSKYLYIYMVGINLGNIWVASRNKGMHKLRPKNSMTQFVYFNQGLKKRTDIEINDNCKHNRESIKNVFIKCKKKVNKRWITYIYSKPIPYYSLSIILLMESVTKSIYYRIIYNITQVI